MPTPRIVTQSETCSKLRERLKRGAASCLYTGLACFNRVAVHSHAQCMQSLLRHLRSQHRRTSKIPTSSRNCLPRTDDAHPPYMAQPAVSRTRPRSRRRQGSCALYRASRTVPSRRLLPASGTLPGLQASAQQQRQPATAAAATLSNGGVLALCHVFLLLLGVRHPHVHVTSRVSRSNCSAFARMEACAFASCRQALEQSQW